MRPNVILLFSAISSSAVAAPALATVMPDEIVVSVTRSDQPLSRIGQAITVITPDLLRERQAVAVSDLLATTPGIAVSRNGGVGGVTSVRIRGAESDHTMVLIDGVKANDPAAVGGGFNFADLLVGNIERIEVLRGPNSVLWGSQAIGGIVNIVTAAPTTELRANARAEYGWRDTGQLVGNVSGAFGPVSASIGGGWYRTDGNSAFNEDRGATERDGYENYGANARFNIKLSDDVSVDLRGWYTHGRNEFDGFPPPNFTFADTLEYSKTRELTGYAGLNIALLDGRFRNRFAFAYTDTDRKHFNPGGFLFVTFDGAGRNERFEYQGDFTLADGWQTVFGAETEKSHLVTSSFGGPATRGSARISSVYGQLVMSPFAGLTLTGGARYDHHSSFGDETTFGANLAWTPNDGATLLRASYGEGFKAPTLYQLQSEYGNLNLQPERAKSWDVGVEQRLLDGAIVAGATWFHRNTRNQIDFVSCFRNPAPICNGRGNFGGFYDNIQKSRARGLEFTLDIHPVEALSVRAQYTYVDAENRITGGPLPRRPKNVVSASIDYRWPFGLSTGATLLHVDSSRESSFSTAVNEGYVLGSLRASYPLTERIELYGRVENLFDEHYETTLRYGSPGRAAYGGVRLSF